MGLGSSLGLGDSIYMFGREFTGIPPCEALREEVAHAALMRPQGHISEDSGPL